MRVLLAVALLIASVSALKVAYYAAYDGSMEPASINKAGVECSCDTFKTYTKYRGLVLGSDACRSCVSLIPAFTEWREYSASASVVPSEKDVAFVSAAVAAAAAAADPVALRAAVEALDASNLTKRVSAVGADLTDEELVALEIESAARAGDWKYARLDVQLFAPPEDDEEARSFLYDASTAVVHAGCRSFFLLPDPMGLSVLAAIAPGDASNDPAALAVAEADLGSGASTAADLGYAPFDAPEICNVTAVANALAAIPGVREVSQAPVRKFFNAWSSRVLQGASDPAATNPVDINPSVTIGAEDKRWLDTLSPAVTGVGEMVAVSDSGLDVDHCHFYDPNMAKPPTMQGSPGSLTNECFSNPSSVGSRDVLDISSNLAPVAGVHVGDSAGDPSYHRKVACYWAFQDDSDSLESHGTHVCGTVAGAPPTEEAGHAVVHKSGRIDSWSLRGGAPGARLFFIDMKDGEDGNLTAFGDYAMFFGSAWAAGARVHSASWGSTIAVNQTSFPDVFDGELYALRDMTMLAAAGNEAGNSVSSYSGRNPFFTTGTPCSYKNVLCVGATRAASSAWATICNHTKFRNDGLIGAAYQYCQYATRTNTADFTPNVMALFSSRGPTPDGRVKPDLVAPGDFVFSARSLPDADLATMEHHCTLSDSSISKASFFSNQGTSMATPALAGNVALLRDFLQHHTLTNGVAALTRPSSALIRSMLIASAEEMQSAMIIPAITGINSGESVSIARNDLPFPSHTAGFGRPVLRRILGAKDRGSTVIAFDEVDTGMQCKRSGDWHKFTFTLQDPGSNQPFTEDLRVAIAWTSPSGMTGTRGLSLSNDISLFIQDPDGNVHIGNHGVNGGRTYAFRDVDHVNSAQRIRIPASHVKPGAWFVYVHCQFINDVIAMGDIQAESVPDGNVGILDGSQPIAMTALMPGELQLPIAVDVPTGADSPRKYAIENPNGCWAEHGRGTPNAVTGECDCTADGWGGPDCSIRTHELTADTPVFYYLEPGDRVRFKVRIEQDVNFAFKVTSGQNIGNVEEWSGGQGVPWKNMIIDITGRTCVDKNAPLADRENKALCDNVELNHYELRTMPSLDPDGKLGEMCSNFAACDYLTMNFPSTVVQKNDGPTNVVDNVPYSFAKWDNPTATAWWVLELFVKDPVAHGSVKIEFATNDCTSACYASGTCSGTTCTCNEGWTGSSCENWPDAALGHKALWLFLGLLTFFLM